jgi:hypothetical protein
VLDALDEISRRVEESKDAVPDDMFIDGVQYLMLHLVKPIVNQTFGHLSLSVMFSCLKPVLSDQTFAHSFKYVDCEKCALTDSDKAVILES